jgi:hypothetical protein
MTYYPARRIRNMPKFAIAVITAVALVLPALSVADANAKPSSFVPHPHTKNHVYGSPIQPAVVGHAKTSHHKSALKKRSPSAANRDAH